MNTSDHNHASSAAQSDLNPQSHSISPEGWPAQATGAPEVSGVKPDLPREESARASYPCFGETGARLGKIARLPRAVREELNWRLYDGEPANALVPWLNGAVEVKRVMWRYFGGRPINEQNLSAWRQGGYGDWVRNQRAVEAGFLLEDDLSELEAQRKRPTAERLATMAAMSMGHLLREAMQMESGETQRRALLQVNREIMKLGECERKAAQAKREAETYVRAVADDRDRRKNWALSVHQANREQLKEAYGYAKKKRERLEKRGAAVPEDLKRFLDGEDQTRRLLKQLSDHLQGSLPEEFDPVVIAEEEGAVNEEAAEEIAAREADEALGIAKEMTEDSEQRTGTEAQAANDDHRMTNRAGRESVAEGRKGNEAEESAVEGPEGEESAEEGPDAEGR